MGERQSKRIFHPHALGKRIDFLLGVKGKHIHVLLEIPFRPCGIGRSNNAFHFRQGEFLIKAAIIQNDTQPVFDLSLVLLHVQPKKLNFASLFVGEPQERPQGSGLARAIDANKARYTALRQRKGNVFQREIAVAFPQPGHFQNVVHVNPPRTKYSSFRLVPLC